MRTQILVAVHGDDEPTRDAVALGVMLARRLEADLRLTGIWASPFGSSDGLVEGTVRSQIEHELVRLRRTVPDDVLTRTEVRGATSVVRGLHKVAARRHADILVLGSGRHEHAVRGLRGDIVLSTTHDAPCAVAVAPAGLRDREEIPPDVALAWDGTPKSQAALESAVAIARRSGGTLHVVFVLEPGRRAARPPAVAPRRLAAWTTPVLGFGKVMLDDAEAAVDDRVPATYELRHGRVAVELADAAAPCGLLVAGTRGAGSFRRLVAGSTTAELLDRTATPVLFEPAATVRRTNGVRPRVAVA